MRFPRWPTLGGKSKLLFILLLLALPVIVAVSYDQYNPTIGHTQRVKAAIYSEDTFYFKYIYRPASSPIATRAKGYQSTLQIALSRRVDPSIVNTLARTANRKYNVPSHWDGELYSAAKSFNMHRGSKNARTNLKLMLRFPTNIYDSHSDLTAVYHIIMGGKSSVPQRQTAAFVLKRLKSKGYKSSRQTRAQAKRVYRAHITTYKEYTGTDKKLIQFFAKRGSELAVAERNKNLAAKRRAAKEKKRKEQARKKQAARNSANYRAPLSRGSIVYTCHKQVALFGASVTYVACEQIVLELIGPRVRVEATRRCWKHYAGARKLLKHSQVFWGPDIMRKGKAKRCKKSLFR